MCKKGFAQHSTVASLFLPRETFFSVEKPKTKATTSSIGEKYSRIHTSYIIHINQNWKQIESCINAFL